MDRSADTTANGNSDRIARVAWFCAFVLPLALAALLLGVKSAQAAPPPPERTPSAFEEELFGEEEFGEEDEAQLEAEFAEAECETAKEEAAAGEIAAAEADEVCSEAEEATKEAAAGSGDAASAVCPIRSAGAHASIHHHRLKLTVGYTTNSPVTAVIQLRGPLRASFKRRLGKSGVLRFTRALHKRHGRLTVRIKLPASERAACPSHRLVLLAR